MSRFMSHRAAIAVIALCAAVALPAPWSPALSAPATAPLPAVGVQAQAHVRALAAMGPRVAGTPVERRGAEYIAGQLRSLGYTVQLQPFTFPYFETRSVSLQTVAPRAVSLRPRTLIYSAATRGTITAELVAAGRARPEDFSNVTVRGKIALVERGVIPFAMKAANAAERGAVAIIVFNNEPGDITGTLGSASAIPAVMIGQAEGQQLLELIRQGPVEVALNVETASGERTSANVIGTTPGGTGRRIVIGGHYDSVESSPGANDNASGVAAMLEVARLLRADGAGPRPNVEFVAFGAEELGLFGSRHYASSQRIQGVGAMINMDMVGVGDRLLIGNSGGNERVVDAAMEAARRLGIQVTRQRMGASDHQPFERAGVPAVFLHWTPDQNYHSPGDTADRVLPENLEAAIRIAAATARTPALVAALTPVHSFQASRVLQTLSPSWPMFSPARSPQSVH